MIFKVVELSHQPAHVLFADGLTLHVSWCLIVENEFLVVEDFKATDYSWFSKVFFKENLIIYFIANFVTTLKNKMDLKTFIHFISNLLIWNKEPAFKRIHDAYHEVAILFIVILIIRIFNWVILQKFRLGWLIII